MSGGRRGKRGGAARGSRRQGGPASSSSDAELGRGRRSAREVEERGISSEEEEGGDSEDIPDISDIPADEEDDEGEDLFANMEQDYQAIPELDRYTSEGMASSSEDIPAMTMEERRRAEQVMEERERLQARNRRGRDRRPAALLSSSDGRDPRFDGDGMDVDRAMSSVSQVSGAEDFDLGFEEEDEGELIHLERELKGPLREFIVKDAPRREIARRFRRFLETDLDVVGDEEVIVNLITIERMTHENKCSLEIDFSRLSAYDPVLAVWLVDAPSEMLKIFDEVATRVTLRLFPNYKFIEMDIRVRITDVPVRDSLRDLRQIHLNGLVKVDGVVTRRTGIFPQLRLVKYDCVKCRHVIGPLPQNTTKEVRPGKCPSCQSSGPFHLNVAQTVYQNYQKITLQESPGTVPAGRLPRSKDVILLGDLIDSCRPGEEIEVTGIYQNNFDSALNTKQGFPVFATLIEANYINKKMDTMSGFHLTEEDQRAIHELSKDPRIATRVFKSIGPSIFGHEHVKSCIALSLFGGVAKEAAGKHRIRGDINVLLLGDPGTAKSQFLKYVEKTAHRAVFTTGKGSTAVGLTAAVHRDPITREWTLEGGALVLADNGVCLIDEFDKMSDQDRTSIHEAMEQQSISIAKAGIVTSLQARCAVMAAANPIRGRYDSSLTFAQNVELTDAILSRFDALCVIRDHVDPVKDEQLADFVVSSHMASHPNFDAVASAHLLEEEVDPDMIPQPLLRKYIMYAKEHCKPKLHNIDENAIKRLYSALRQESSASGGVPISVRHVESIIRMAEAHAKMHLRDHVQNSDVHVAIRTLLESFISTQKFQIMRSLRKKFARFIFRNREHNELLLHLLQNLVTNDINFKRESSGANPSFGEVSLKDFKSQAEHLDIQDVSDFLSSRLFVKSGFQLDMDQERIIRRFDVD